LSFASALRQEEAEIAAALVRIGQTLNAHLGQPDMLERVIGLAVDALGGDFGAIFVRDDRRHAFRLAAHAKARPEVAAEVAQIDFAPDSSPLARALRPGELLEIEDAEHQPYVPPEVLRRWDTASELCAPVARRGEVIAVMTFAYRTRTGPFSSEQRRLALGIADATAVALETARLIAALQAAGPLRRARSRARGHGAAGRGVALARPARGAPRAQRPREGEDDPEEPGRQRAQVHAPRQRRGARERGRRAARHRGARHRHRHRG